jgi:hypothetical protein
MYRSGSLNTVVRELARYGLDLGGVQTVRWDKGCAVIINWEQDFFVHQRIVTAIRRGVFVSDRIAYILLRGGWCNIIVLNAHGPSE